MLVLISEFFGIIGLDVTPPVDFASLMPWLITIFLGIAMIAFIFKMFAAIVRAICGQRWL